MVREREKESSKQGQEREMKDVCVCCKIEAARNTSLQLGSKTRLLLRMIWLSESRVCSHRTLGTWRDFREKFIMGNVQSDEGEPDNGGWIGKNPTVGPVRKTTRGTHQQ